MSSYTCEYCGQYIGHWKDNQLQTDPSYHPLFCPAKKLYDKLEQMIIEKQPTPLPTPTSKNQ